MPYYDPKANKRMAEALGGRGARDRDRGKGSPNDRMLLVDRCGRQTG